MSTLKEVNREYKTRKLCSERFFAKEAAYLQKYIHAHEGRIYLQSSWGKSHLWVTANAKQTLNLQTYVEQL